MLLFVNVIRALRIQRKLFVPKQVLRKRRSTKRPSKRGFEFDSQPSQSSAERGPSRRGYWFDWHHHNQVPQHRDTRCVAQLKICLLGEMEELVWCPVTFRDEVWFALHPMQPAAEVGLQEAKSSKFCAQLTLMKSNIFWKLSLNFAVSVSVRVSS